MERSNSSYKERGSELCNDFVKESGKGQRLTELVVHRALGINSKASTDDNLNGFKPMTEDNEHEFNREEIAVWFRILSVRGRYEADAPALVKELRSTRQSSSTRMK